MNNNQYQTQTEIVQWTIRGANWVWKKYDSLCRDPLELATQALESFWNRANEALSPEEAWKRPEGSSIELPTNEPPSLGMVVSAEHTKMTDPTEKILVCSVTALSNAGFHNDASRLIAAWDKEKTGQP